MIENILKTIYEKMQLTAAGVKSRFEQMSKRKKAFVLAAAAMVMILLLASAAGKTALADKAKRMTYDEPYASEARSEKGVMNVLLLGTDSRLEGTEDPGRCDCTMLCSVNLRSGSIKLVSFERGIYVPVNDWQGDLLTHGYQYGGARKMLDIISGCFDVPVDGYAHVDFDTFALVVDALGGVDIELTQEEADALNGDAWYTNTYASAPVQAGMNHLCGADALLYCRLRSTDDNWQRQQRQRNMINALIRDVKKMGVLRLNKAVNEALPYINTSLTKRDVKLLLKSAGKVLLKNDIEELQVPEKNRNEWNGVDCSFPEQGERIREFIR